MMNDVLFTKDFYNSEMSYRMKLMKEFTKKEHDFLTLSEYNDYLEKIEDFIYELASGDNNSNIIWEEVNKFKELHHPSSLIRIEPKVKKKKKLRISIQDSNFSKVKVNDEEERMKDIKNLQMKNVFAMTRQAIPIMTKKKKKNIVFTDKMKKMRRIAGGWSDKWWIEKAVRCAFDFSSL